MSRPIVTAALALAACTAPPPRAVEPAAAAERRVDDLLAAEPAAWHEAMPPVLAAGADALPALRTGLQAAGRAPSSHPGRAPGVAVYGALGTAGDLAVLERMLDGDPEMATEAALALGRRQHTASRDALRRCAADASRPTSTRAAATASLIRLGFGAACLEPTRALLLAATPAGRDAGRTAGLPRRTRWALERHIVLDAIADATGGERFGMDPDAPWPRLASGVEAWARWLEERRR